jgi:SAM-dependent methyltransferase
MTVWSRGYVADSPYTTGWQGYFQPAHLAAVAALNGVAFTPPADCAIAELGCGRGFSAAAIAAGAPRYGVWAFDYNPAHVAEARELGAQAGLANLHVAEADLAAMSDAELDRLPEFDVVALHGVWTWVADPVREGIVRFVARRLKPGGLLYVGYNSLPGFGAETAFQRLMWTAARHAAGDSIARARAAAAAVRRLAAAEPVQLPRTGLLKRITDEKEAPDPAYIAHEFLTAHWRPSFFADLAAAFAAAKCDFVGSVTLWENLPDLVFTAEQRPDYEAFDDIGAKELVKDLCLTRPFRRDVFVRGARRVERDAALDAILLALVQPPPESMPKLAVQHGAAELPLSMAVPILAALAEGPQPIGRLRRLPEGRQPNPGELLVMLYSSGLCLPFCPDQPAGPAAARFNGTIAHRYADAGRSRAPLALAAPLAGGAIPATALEVALAARLLAGGDPGAPKEAVARDLLPMLNDQEAGEVGTIIATTLRDRLPVWRRFGVL